MSKHNRERRVAKAYQKGKQARMAAAKGVRVINPYRSWHYRIVWDYAFSGR